MDSGDSNKRMQWESGLMRSMRRDIMRTRVCCINPIRDWGKFAQLGTVICRFYFLSVTEESVNERFQSTCINECFTWMTKVWFGVTFYVVPCFHVSLNDSNELNEPHGRQTLAS